MIVRVVKFRRDMNSKYEKGLYFEKSELLLDSEENILGEVYDIIYDVTCIDFTNLIK